MPAELRPSETNWPEQKPYRLTLEQSGKTRKVVILPIITGGLWSVYGWKAAIAACFAVFLSDMETSARQDIERIDAAKRCGVDYDFTRGAE